MRNKFFIGLVLSVFIFLGMACESKKVSHILVVGTAADYPPFEFRRNGELVGLDIDLAHFIAKELGYELKIRDMEFSTLIPALQNGQIDFALSGMTATPERRKNLDFTQIYYHNSFALMVKGGENLPQENEWSGKKVGVQLGTTMEKASKEKLGSKGVHFVSLGKNSILIEELKAGRLDSVVMEKVQAQAFAKVHQGLRFFELKEWTDSLSEGYAIAFPKSKNSGELRVKIDEILSKLSQSGQLEQLTQKWLVSSPGNSL